MGIEHWGGIRYKTFRMACLRIVIFSSRESSEATLHLDVVSDYRTVVLFYFRMVY